MPTPFAPVTIHGHAFHPSPACLAVTPVHAHRHPRPSRPHRVPRCHPSPRPPSSMPVSSTSPCICHAPASMPRSLSVHICVPHPGRVSLTSSTRHLPQPPMPPCIYAAPRQTYACPSMYRHFPVVSHCAAPLPLWPHLAPSPRQVACAQVHVRLPMPKSTSGHLRPSPRHLSPCQVARALTSPVPKRLFLCHLI